MTVIPELLALRARLAPDTVGIVTPSGVDWSYRRWDARSRELASGLRRAGVGPGDRVGVFVNEAAIADYAALYTALAHVGAYAAIGMSHWTPQEAGRNFEQVRTIGAITAGGMRVSPSPGRWVVDIEELGGHTDDVPVACRPDDLAQIIFTSGTTGVSKPVAATHRNLIGGFTGMTGEEALAEPEQFLSVMPIGSQSAQSMVIGSLTDRVVCRVLDGFDAEVFCRAIEQHGCEYTLLMPAIAQQLAAFDTSPYTVSALGRIFITGAATPPATLARLAGQFTGCTIFNVYGTTESWPTFLTSEFDPARPRSIGKLLDATMVRIADGDGRPAVPGERGEVQLRAGREHVGGRGYLDLDTGELSVSDGWVSTGDIGYVDDDGYICVVDRSVRIIQAYEDKFSPLEVEFALAEHPSVAAVAVFDVQPEGADQVVVAAVVTRGDTVSDDDLRAYAVARLPGFMVPDRFMRCATLPLTPARKVDLRRLTADWSRAEGVTLEVPW